MSSVRAFTSVQDRPARQPGKAKKAKSARKPYNELKAWSYAGVGLTLTASAGLNGLAFAECAPLPWQGWGLGIAIPVMLLVFARVSALLWGQGRRGLAYCGGMACLSMLLLSVQHCACSISRLTGEHVGLAALMALAIDAGLVVCELATIKAK